MLRTTHVLTEINDDDYISGAWKARLQKHYEALGNSRNLGGIIRSLLYALIGCIGY